MPDDRRRSDPDDLNPSRLRRSPEDERRSNYRRQQDADMARLYPFPADPLPGDPLYALLEKIGKIDGGVTSMQTQVNEIHEKIDRMGGEIVLLSERGKNNAANIEKISDAITVRGVFASLKNVGAVAAAMTAIGAFCLAIWKFITLSGRVPGASP